MSQATESKFFQEQKGKSLNALQNGGAPWSIQPKALMQVKDAVDRLTVDLEEGILAKLRLQREQQLLGSLAERCYKNNDYTYSQAMACEDFYGKNDFKLNLLKTFVRDHMTKHLMEYEKCYTGEAFEAIAANEDKDREFSSCHNRWIQRIKSDVAFELDVKARSLFAQTQ